MLFVAGAVATFPLFVPPFFLPLYSASLGLSPLVGASLVAGFNLSSAVGRVGCGFLCDRAGPLNTLILALSLSTVSILTLWPSTIAPLIAFVVINGAANGGFFASMPTVLGNVFGLARLSTAMGMIVIGWAGGYLMVSGPKNPIPGIRSLPHRERRLQVIFSMPLADHRQASKPIVPPYIMLDQ